MHSLCASVYLGVVVPTQALDVERAVESALDETAQHVGEVDQSLAGHEPHLGLAVIHRAVLDDAGRDDALDVVAVHLVGGVIGALLIGVLARESIGGTGAGVEQFGRQALSVVVAFAYSFILTYVIARILDFTMGIRASEEEERRGLDVTLHDEQSYQLVD